MPNWDETCTIEVNGQRFYDWETVWIQLRWTEAYPIFRFTCAERNPLPGLWTKLQFMPGDEVAIYLAGILVVSGVILVRQVAYDAEHHGVMLQGVGVTWYAARGSILGKNNFDGMNWKQVADSVLAPFGIPLKPIGALNPEPFARLQNEPGETVWNFLERIARPRGIVLGSDEQGNMLGIDNHTMPVTATLLEGKHILRCQCTIAVRDIFSDYWVRGQTAASDEQHGRQASEQEANAPGTAKHYSPRLTVAEQPVWGIGELKERAAFEALWHESTIIEADITVQGWLKPIQPIRALWAGGDDVYVKSPMAVLDMVMKAEVVTFTQDRQTGTLTVLHLVAPWRLKDRSDFNVGNPNAPTPPGAARSTMDKAPVIPPPKPRSDPPAPTIPRPPTIPSS